MGTPRSLVPATLVLVIAAGCGSGPDPLEAAPVETAEVAVADNVFEPIAVSVPVGTEVVWTWEGRANHNVVGEGFESELVPTGTFAHTFDRAGTHEYVCTIHARMRGAVVVR